MCIFMKGKERVHDWRTNVANNLIYFYHKCLQVFVMISTFFIFRDELLKITFLIIIYYTQSSFLQLFYRIIFEQNILTKANKLNCDWNINLYKYGSWNVAKIEMFIVCCIFMLYEVSFWLYISYLCYMFYYVFIIYLYVYYMFFNFVIYFFFHIIWFWICVKTFLFSLYVQKLL